MHVLQLDGEPFLEMFNSTGPFEGVPDDVDIEDIPAKHHEVYSLHVDAVHVDAEGPKDHGSGTPHASAASQTPDHATATPAGSRRVRHFFERESQDGKSSDADSVCLPFPIA